MYTYLKQMKKSNFLIKMENRRTGQVLSGDWYQWEKGGYGEVSGSVCGANIVYTYM
jgi:hypothetical protein